MLRFVPFRSAKQRRFLYAKHPALARRWSRKYGSKIRRAGRRRGGRRR